MRELKFRVWDTQNKCYVENKNGGIEWSIWELEHLLEYRDRVIIEQYTGLKDKNGKEIYEGDIVVNTYYDDDEMYKVLWADDSVAFGMESLDDMELYKLPLESLEVIGNIHENHELLEGKE